MISVQIVRTVMWSRAPRAVMVILTHINAHCGDRNAVSQAERILVFGCVEIPGLGNAKVGGGRVRPAIRSQLARLQLFYLGWRDVR